jgi:hypothetical protein
MAIAIINADRALSVFAAEVNFPTFGKEGPLYFSRDTGKIYRWDYSGAAYVEIGGGGGVTDHGLLTGLADDDHPQYALDTDLGNYQPLDATLTAIAADTLGAFGHRNKIINGNLDIWQRATSQTTSDYGSDDRWFNINIGSTKTHSRQAFTLGQTAVPGEPKFFSRTAVTSVAGVGNTTLKRQAIEDVRTFAGKTVTLSFYAKADVAKNIAIEFVQVFGTGGTPSANVSGIGSQLVALTTSWQKFTKTIAIPSISGETLGTNGNDYLQFSFWFEAGTDFSARTASLGQQSGTFDIAQVQLEEGSVATPFEHRPIGTELALCQRYYDKGVVQINSYVTGTGALGTTATFKQIMRTVPTVTAAVDTASNVDGTPNILAFDASSCRIYHSISGTGAGYFRDNWTASAEL